MLLGAAAVGGLGLYNSADKVVNEKTLGGKAAVVGSSILTAKTNVATPVGDIPVNLASVLGAKYGSKMGKRLGGMLLPKKFGGKWAGGALGGLLGYGSGLFLDADTIAKFAGADLDEENKPAVGKPPTTALPDIGQALKVPKGPQKIKRKRETAKSLPATPADNSIVGEIDGFMRALSNGMTFGFSDNIAAGMGAATGVGGKFGDYSGNLQREQAKSDKYDEDHPILSTGANIAGGVIDSMAIPLKGAGMALTALGALTHGGTDLDITSKVKANGMDKRTYDMTQHDAEAANQATMAAMMAASVNKSQSVQNNSSSTSAAFQNNANIDIKRDPRDARNPKLSSTLGK
jgi:hypothetical protein